MGTADFTHAIEVNGPQDLRYLGQRLEWLRSRLSELEEQQNRFLRHVSHELKTPLTAVREGAELLRDNVGGKLSPRAARHRAHRAREHAVAAEADRGPAQLPPDARDGAGDGRAGAAARRRPPRGARAQARGARADDHVRRAAGAGAGDRRRREAAHDRRQPRVERDQVFAAVGRRSRSTLRRSRRLRRARRRRPGPRRRSGRARADLRLVLPGQAAGRRPRQGLGTRPRDRARVRARARRPHRGAGSRRRRARRALPAVAAAGARRRDDRAVARVRTRRRRAAPARRDDRAEGARDGAPRCRRVAAPGRMLLLARRAAARRRRRCRCRRPTTSRRGAAGGCRRRRRWSSTRRSSRSSRRSSCPPAAGGRRARAGARRPAPAGVAGPAAVPAPRDRARRRAAAVRTHRGAAAGRAAGRPAALHRRSPPTRFAARLAAATQALARQRTDANRVRLAVLYTLARAGPQDDQRALQLLDNVAKSGPAPPAAASSSPRCCRCRSPSGCARSATSSRRPTPRSRSSRRCGRWSAACCATASAAAAAAAAAAVAAAVAAAAAAAVAAAATDGDEANMTTHHWRHPAGRRRSRPAQADQPAADVGRAIACAPPTAARPRSRRSRSRGPAVVITDLRMPGIDGMQLFEAIHRQHPALPVIILTAHGTIPDAVAATQRGVFGFLTKPFDSQDLLQKVAAALKRRRRRRRPAPTRPAASGARASSPAARRWRTCCGRRGWSPIPTPAC